MLSFKATGYSILGPNPSHHNHLKAEDLHPSKAQVLHLQAVIPGP